MRRRLAGALALPALVIGAAAGCAPEPAPATRLALTTELTWCGGVIPPPGEPWCRTNPTSATVDVSVGRTTVATVTTGADGSGLIDVAPGRYRLTVADVPAYMTCESPIVTVVAGATTAATVGCTVMAP